MENTLQASELWTEEELAIWKPADDITISEWAEKYRILGDQAEEKGPLRLIRTPYLRPILDACLNKDVETVVFCKSAQVAGTEAMISVMGYYAHQEPCPIMLILADEDTAGYICEMRIKGMFKKHPDLSKLIDYQKFNKEDITLKNGAYITMGWPSVSRLGSRPIRIVICDEIDKPGYYRKSKEASFLSLAGERTESFYNFKILLLSTPTMDTGNIWEELTACDVIYDYHVPCPHCGQYQPMRWSRKYSEGFNEGMYFDEKGELQPLGEVVWKGGREATEAQIEAAGYKCGSCEGRWSTVQKNNAVEKGRMIKRAHHEKPRKVGYHINRLYSLLGKSGDIPKLVRAFITAIKSGDPKKIQGFVNSALAEPWKQSVTKTTESSVLKARCSLPPQIVPQEAVALTCGIDMQKRGFWFVVRAWARDYTSWLIHYGSLGTWEDVENLLFKTEYKTLNGESRRIWRAALDTGGGLSDTDTSMTEQAYMWLRDHAWNDCRIWGTKGSSRPLANKIQIKKSIDRTPSGKPLPGGLQIVLLDPSQLKDLFFYRLSQAKNNDIHAAYLHKDTDDQYALQITAEEKRLNDKGLPEWYQIRQNNHLLDCECLASAVAEPEWIGGGVNLLYREEKTDEEPKAAKQQKSRW